MPMLSTIYKKKCGIYKITIGDKFYFGSSANLYNRAYQHLPELRHGRHKNRFMQRAYDKYKDINFEVILLCEPSERRELEQKLLQTCIDDKHCMNLTLRTEGPSGIVWTKEARKKMSEKMKGNTNGHFGKGVSRTMCPEGRAKQIASVRKRQNKKVTVTNPNGETITFESRTKAAEYFKVPIRTLTTWVLEPKRTRRQYLDWTFHKETVSKWLQ